MPPLDAATLIAALDLPSGCRVDQRVPKKLLVENGAPTTADKRKINDGIEEIHWLAALKPTTIGVPDYRDEMREYLEIAVLTVTLRPDAKVGRLAELTHRAVPYPVFLIMVAAGTNELTLSLAHKRGAQNEAEKVVLDGSVVEARLGGQPSMATHEAQFMEAIALGRQPRATLYALYQGWVDTLAALQAALITGQFVVGITLEQTAARRAALYRYRDIDNQITSLRATAVKEKQLSRQVTLNLEIKRLQAERAEMLALL